MLQWRIGAPRHLRDTVHCGSTTTHGTSRNLDARVQIGPDVRIFDQLGDTEHSAKQAERLQQQACGLLSLRRLLLEVLQAILGNDNAVTADL